MGRWFRFGGLLPFVGFRENTLDAETVGVLGLPHGTTKVDEFCLEWFNVGVVLCVKVKS